MYLEYEIELSGVIECYRIPSSYNTPFCYRRKENVKLLVNLRICMGLERCIHIYIYIYMCIYNDNYKVKSSMSHH